MKKIFLLVLCYSISSQLFSQHLNYTLYEILHKEDVKSSAVDFDNQYTGIIGTAFLTEQWTPGRCFTLMKSYSINKMRFDVYKNKVYLNSNDTIYDITNSGIIQFDIYPDGDSTKKISFNNGFNVEEITPEKFVQVLNDGKVVFLKYLRTEIDEVYETSPTYKDKKFLARNKYYIIDDNQSGSEVSLNKKNLEKVLSAKWEEITKYAKSNNLSMNNERGWTKLIEYYNKM